MQSTKTELFEKVPIGRALLIMAVPTIVSQLITMIYNLADTFFIGMSDDPYKVAAASVVSILYFLLTSLSNLFGVGGGSLLSRLLGEKRENDARRVCSFSIYGTLIISAIYSLINLVLSRQLCLLMGASPNTLDYAQSYLFWAVVVGGIPSTLSMTFSHLLRSAGYSKESGIGLALGGISNIILDPLFMFYILPAGNEVTGAAIATMLANIISMIYFIFVFMRLSRKTVLTLSPKHAHISRELTRQVFAIGLPSAITSLLANITAIVKNNLTADHNDIALAAFGIVLKMDMLPLNVGMGLCQGMMPLVAYNYASKNYPRMKAFTRAAQLSGIAVACGFIVVSEIFAPQLIWLFIKDAQTISYGKDFLRIACLATPFIISNFQKIYCLQAMGKGKESLILGCLRQGIFAIPMLFIMNSILGLYGVVAAQLISDGLTFICSTLIYRKVYNDLVKKESVL